MIAGIIAVVIIGIVLLALSGAGGGERAEEKKKLHSDLIEIKNEIKEDTIDSNRDAIIKLDTILSKSLQYKFRNNEPCGTNLKESRELFDKKLYNEIWEYHKLRNNVVHESVDVSDSELKSAYKVFSQAVFKLTS